MDSHMPARTAHAFAAVISTVAVLAGASRGSAAEIVVRNDSVENFNLVAVFGGFTTGEEGGSRLTSPCDGSIVGIQILWWAGDPGALPYLGENIWIRRAETFPAPGDVLQQLSGPILQPFVLNEFRHVDESQTVPLNVPVSADQIFAVTLEFSEPTDPQSGSMTRDVGDGCQAGRNLLFAPGLGGWLDFCGFPVFLQGDVVVRAVIDCADPPGACCLPDGSCIENISDIDCQGIGGTFQGEGSDCNAIECPLGDQACCFQPAGCLDLNPADCETAGGFPQGAGSACAAVECFPSGACCLPDGTCIDNLSPEECNTAGGAFQGNTTTCGAADCPQPIGACCLSNGGCLNLIEADCVVIPQSTWAGAITDCADVDMNGTADACEPSCGVPWEDADRDCDVDLDDFAAFGQCATGAGGTATAACTCFDTDGDGDVDIHDYGRLTVAFTGAGGGCP